MKHLTKFETNDVFNILKSSLDLPNISLIKETNEINFLPYIKSTETRLVCVFSPYTTEEPTDLISTYWYDGNESYDPLSVFSAIEIDGVEQPSDIISYQFNTEDDHTVKYTLADPTTIVKGCFGGYSEYDVPIKSVIIPNSVTSIGDCAFEGCEAIDKIIIPDITRFKLNT